MTYRKGTTEYPHYEYSVVVKREKSQVTIRLENLGKSADIDSSTADDPSLRKHISAVLAREFSRFR